MPACLNCPSHPVSRHPWSHVVIGMWRKYPNPRCTHVISVDVVDRSVDPKTGIIRTERILGCKQKAPKWIVKVRTLEYLCALVSSRSRPCSSLVVQKMLLCARCPSSTLRPKIPLSPLSIFPSPSLPPATKLSATLLPHQTEHASHKQPKSTPA